MFWNTTLYDLMYGHYQGSGEIRHFIFYLADGGNRSFRNFTA